MLELSLETSRNWGALTLLHVDAYRLGEEDEQTLGLDAAREGESVLVVEWAERMNREWPAKAMHITLEHSGRESRCVEIECDDSCAARFEAVLGRCGVDG